MKKLFVIMGCICLILFSCHKRHDPDLALHQKPDLINQGSKGVFFKIIDIYSRLSAIKRRIDVINKSTNAVLGKMFITLSCNDPNDNLYRKINYEPEKFSGLITLESSHLIKFTKRILKGKQIKVETLVGKDVDANSKPGFEPDIDPDPVSSFNPDPDNRMEAFCSIFSIAKCATTTIENTNWLDFALCAITTNFCLIYNFGICAEQLCK